jgi:serine/threonine-protein kinase RsbW
LEKKIADAADGVSPEGFIGDLRQRYIREGSGAGVKEDIAAIAIEFLTQSRKNQIKEKLGFKGDDPVYLQFISYFEEMDRTAAIVLSAMDSRGYPDDGIRQMKIILTELFANAIYHGNKEDHSKKVTVGHIINKKKVVVSIMDEGEGFDPEVIPDPTLPENLVKDCGRGLFIVRSYVDKLYFNEAGNRVTIVKNYRGRNEQS